MAERDLPPMYLNGEMHHGVSSVDSYRHVLRSQPVGSRSQPGVPVHERGSPPPYRVPMETHDAPLNLSLTSSSSAFTPQVSRPSVITCASTVDKSHRYGNSSPSQHSLPSPNRREVVSGGYILYGRTFHKKYSVAEMIPECLSESIHNFISFFDISLSRQRG